MQICRLAVLSVGDVRQQSYNYLSEAVIDYPLAAQERGTRNDTVRVLSCVPNAYFAFAPILRYPYRSFVDVLGHLVTSAMATSNDIHELTSPTGPALILTFLKAQGGIGGRKGCFHHVSGIRYIGGLPQLRKALFHENRIDSDFTRVLQFFILSNKEADELVVIMVPQIACVWTFPAVGLLQQGWPDASTASTCMADFERDDV